MISNDENIYRNDYVFTYNPQVPCVEMEIFGYANSKQFRDLTEELLNLIKFYKVERVLANTRYMVMLGASDQEWLVQEWFPRALQAGYKACAMLKSHYFFNRIAIENIASKLNRDSFTLKLFDNKAEAIAWLSAFNTNAKNDKQYI